MHRGSTCERTPCCSRSARFSPPPRTRKRPPPQHPAPPSRPPPASRPTAEITCTLPAAAAPKRFNFRATFTGGHDDSSASIAPELDGRPFACGEGSKLSLFGEDGNVSVFCQFDRSALPAAGAKLKVLIKWSHAEFADYEFSGK
jgi:hypothetical protein